MVSPQRRRGRGGILVVVDDSLKTETEDFYVEVDEKTNLPATEFEVCQDLRFMDRQKLLDRLEFNQNLAGDEDIDAVTAIEKHAFIRHRQRLLILKRNV